MCNGCGARPPCVGGAAPWRTGRMRAPEPLCTHDTNTKVRAGAPSGGQPKLLTSHCLPCWSGAHMLTAIQHPPGNVRFRALSIESVPATERPPPLTSARRLHASNAPHRVPWGATVSVHMASHGPLAGCGLSPEHQEGVACGHTRLGLRRDAVQRGAQARGALCHGEGGVNDLRTCSGGHMLALRWTGPVCTLRRPHEDHAWHLRPASLQWRTHAGHASHRVQANYGKAYVP